MSDKWKSNFLSVALCAAVFCGVGSASAASLSNERYTLEVGGDGTITLRTGGMSPLIIAPEFTVLRSERDPQIHRNFNHPNYPIAPRPSLRWLAVNEPANVLNAWLATPAMKAAVEWNAKVTGEGEQRVWEYRDKSGKVVLNVGGRGRDGATRPFAVGEKTVMRATKVNVEGDAVRWIFAANENFTLDAGVRLPMGDGDPEISFTLKPRQTEFFSVAFTGAPSVERKELLRVPQECAGRGDAQGDFVLSEADLKLPRVMTTTREGCLALVADPRECRFRLPKLEDSRFGLMLRFTDSDAVQPVLLAPLLGGAESQMKAGVPWSFTMRLTARVGDWKAMHRHIARDIHGLRDQRDNSGPGTLNDCLERIMDFLADRNGHNHAMWSDEQKYFDYFTDQTGVFKPFSPLYGLSAAIVTDDEDFYRRRALSAVEFALSRKYNVFAPYEGIYEAIVKSAASDVGGPYPGYAQLASLHELLQQRAPVIRSLAEAKGAAKNNIADALAQWRLTGNRAALDAATKAAGAALKSGNVSSEQALFDFLELHDATHDTSALRGAVEAAYHKTTELNLYPAPPDENVLVDKGGLAPVHAHSFGRHKNVWGFQVPEPVVAPEQTVPAWRISRLGVASPAYPMEFWMNTHGALLRTAALAHDDFLHDVARNGMVGRFANYPGDNRSFVSLIAERADAVEAPPWKWSFATVNPGHAWDFAGAVIDFLVAEAFERSHGAIDFPAVSSAGSGFRVRVYGARAGTFFGEKDAPLLGAGSFADFDTAFGKVHAMLLSAGRGLTSAFVYSEAKPQHVIAARLRWRQGEGGWSEETDAIFPYEFSLAIRDDGGAFQCVLEIEDEHRKIQRSPQFTLHTGGKQPAHIASASSGNDSPIAVAPTPLAPAPADFALDVDFLDYMRQASNPKRLGFHDGRFFPYSTPQGRRIGFGLAVWDKRLFAEGCTEAEANAQLGAELFRTHSELQTILAKRPPAMTLTPQQSEVLLDFAHSEGVGNLRADFLAAVLANDWPHILREHSYVRYCGSAPDHARNKAFAQRWQLK